MSVQLMTKWYGIHKLQESMAMLQVELARLSADPHDSKPRRNLVKRVELKMADVLAALQWFEYNNKLDVDPDRLEHMCENFDAYHQKPFSGLPGQTHMRGIVTTELPPLVLTLKDEVEPSTLPSTESVPGSYPDSAEVSHGSR